jgi:serine/threonine protein kinase
MPSTPRDDRKAGWPYASRVALPGTNIAEWRLTAELGRGTTAVVLATEPISGGDPVAIKLPLPGVLQDEAGVQRFLRGARAQRELSHPAVLPVLALGTDPIHGPYLVMPLIDGTTFGAALAAGELPAAHAIDALHAVAGALDAAAAAGVVHRDVKPSNILLGRDGQAWLVDFGLARDHDDDPTTTGALAGTLAYLAPELIRGGEPTPATDRYALACVAYQAMTGRQVFVRATDAAVLFAHVEDPPTPASQLRQQLPAAVDEVLASGLAKEPGQRPTTATAFVEALSDALGAQISELQSPAMLRSTSGTSDPTLDPASGAAQASEAATTDPSPTPRRRRSLMLAAASAGVVAIIGAVLLLSPRQQPEARAADPAPPVPAGQIAIGSSLPLEGLRSGDCDGARPSGTSRACTLSQVRLPSAQVVIPKDGLLRAWAVRGASGDLALQVLRRRDGEIYQIARSETVTAKAARGSGVQRFATELEVEAGDLLALAVEPGATLGRRPAGGATLERWSAQVGAGSREGTLSQGTELLLRAELEPGAVREPPEQLVGAEAAAAPDGRELDASSARLPDGREVRVSLVLVGDRLALDLSRGGIRRSRLFPKGVDPAASSAN